MYTLSHAVYQVAKEIGAKYEQLSATETELHTSNTMSDIQITLDRHRHIVTIDWGKGIGWDEEKKNTFLEHFSLVLQEKNVPAILEVEKEYKAVGPSAILAVAKLPEPERDKWGFKCVEVAPNALTGGISVSESHREGTRILFDLASMEEWEKLKDERQQTLEELRAACKKEGGSFSVDDHPDFFVYGEFSMDSNSWPVFSAADVHAFAALERKALEALEPVKDAITRIIQERYPDFQLGRSMTLFGKKMMINLERWSGTIEGFFLGEYSETFDEPEEALMRFRSVWEGWTSLYDRIQSIPGMDSSLEWTWEFKNVDQYTISFINEKYCLDWTLAGNPDALVSHFEQFVKKRSESTLLFEQMKKWLKERGIACHASTSHSPRYEAVRFRCYEEEYECSLRISPESYDLVIKGARGRTIRPHFFAHEKELHAFVMSWLDEMYYTKRLRHLL